MDKSFSSGTIKIKNINGQIEEFYPITDISAIIDKKTGKSLDSLLDDYDEKYVEIQNNGGIEILFVMPENFDNYSSNTLFAYIESDTFDITIDTRMVSSTNKIGTIPFNMYDSEAILYVDWGDGTTETLDFSNYTENDSSSSKHLYSEPGEYNIKVISSSWNDTSYYHCNSEYSLSSIRYNSITSNFLYFNKTLTKINTSLPKFKDIRIYGDSYNKYYSTNNISDFSYAFSHCNNLTYINPDLFKNNSDITTFSYCFYNCSSLTSIPEHLFDNNTAVTDFSYCFCGCSSLASIPSGLFDNNTAVTDFSYCFSSCSSLTSISVCSMGVITETQPFSEDLFKYNTAVTNFSYCFYNCTKLNNFTIYIGSSLVSSASSFVTKKTGTTRTIKVLTGSTTQTTFNNVATSLGLTLLTQNEESPASSIQIDYNITSEPSNGESYDLNDEITCTITVTNTGNVPLSNIEITCSYTDNEWTIELLEPEESETLDLDEIYVSSNDILNGEISIDTSVMAFTPDEEELNENFNFTIDNIEEPRCIIHLTTTETSAPSNGESYDISEEVEFSIIYSVVEGNVSPFELGEDSIAFGSNCSGNEFILYPDQDSTTIPFQRSYQCSFTITEDNILNESITLDVYCSLSTGDYDGIVTVEKDEAEIVTAEPNLSATVELIETSTPANGINYVVDEVIEFSVTIRNNGNMSLVDNPQSYSSLIIRENNKLIVGFTYSYLEPFNSMTHSNISSYPITANDISNGYVLIYTDVNMIGSNDEVYNNTQQFSLCLQNEYN